MSERITWTHELRVSLYQAVIKFLGHPEDVTRGSRGKPVGMSKAEFLDTLDDIGVAIGVGAGKGGALSNQVAWVTCVPGPGCHQGHWNNRYKNIAAADEAGYFTKSTCAVTPVTVEDEPETTTVTVNGTEVNVFRRVWNKLKDIFS